MVGAGFSRNATPLSSSVKPFPLWWTIAEALGKQLGLSDDAISRKSTTRLPEEFVASFGRDALDDVLLTLVPDQDYAPGEIHERLMRLPWADVFTTNYDDLLERATRVVVERRYNVVCTAEDIPHKRRPRIVKLHGSFPSHRPFITTEEDFRRYPRDRAPFVNLVRQTMMENILVLVGFSGDDPNFQAWAGWVRDQLDRHAPKVYLVELKVDESTRRYLEARNVNVIELSRAFRLGEGTRDELYREAYQQFLDYLEKGKPLSPEEWPAPFDEGEDDGIETLFDIYPFFLSIKDEKSLEADLKECLKQWRKVRLSYPGWVVCPSTARMKLVTALEHCFGSLWERLPKLPPPLRLEVAREVAWMFRMALGPIPGAKWVAATLDEICPFPSLITTTAEITPTSASNLDWIDLGAAWLEAGFGLLSTARQHGDAVGFEHWANILHLLLNRFPTHRSRWYHEQCAFWLGQLNFVRVRQFLQEWPEDWNDPFWETRRAAVQAELGDLEVAEARALRSLQEIRGRVASADTDYQRLSEEGFTLYLLRLLRIARDSFGSRRRVQGSAIDQKGGKSEPFEERFRQLRRDWCDPRDHLETAGGKVRPVREALVFDAVQAKWDFDPDRMTRSHHLESNPWTKWVPTFALLELIVSGGLSYRLGVLGAQTDDVVWSVKNLAILSPSFAVLHAIRMRDKKLVRELLERHRVLSLTQEEVIALCSALKTALTEAIHTVDQEPSNTAYEPDSRFTDTILALGVEALSCLTLRLDQADLLDVLELAKKIYALPRARLTLFHQPLEFLFKRTLFALEPDNLENALGPLLALSVVGELDLDVDRFVEPFDFVDLRELPQRPASQQWNPSIARLTHLAAEGSKHARKRALLRLERLHLGDRLNAVQQRAFGQALWARLDASGLPMDTPFTYLASLLRLPTADGIAVHDLVKRTLLERAVPRKERVPRTAEGFPVVIESSDPYDAAAFLTDLRSCSAGSYPGASVNGLRWTLDEAWRLFRAIRDWWRAEYPKATERLAIDQTRAVTVIGDVLLPLFRNPDCQTQIRGCPMARWAADISLQYRARAPRNTVSDTGKRGYGCCRSQGWVALKRACGKQHRGLGRAALVALAGEQQRIPAMPTPSCTSRA